MHAHRAVFLLMSFYFPVAIMEITELCGAGEWRPRGGAPQLPCAPCPIGMQCMGVGAPEACPAGTMSRASGAARCCPTETRCGEGSAVAAGCGCERIACEEGEALVRVGDRELQCHPAAVSGVKCERCGDGYALDIGCACVKVRGDGWWRVAQARFEQFFGF
jgi:hypothetical protein